MGRLKLERKAHADIETFEFAYHDEKTHIYVPISQEVYLRLREIADDITDRSHSGIAIEEFTILMTPKE